MNTDSSLLNNIHLMKNGSDAGIKARVCRRFRILMRCIWETVLRRLFEGELTGRSIARNFVLVRFFDEIPDHK